MKYNHMSKLARFLILSACLFLGTQQSKAGSYRIDVDTSSLIGDPDGPFSLDFMLIKGGDSATNTVTISNFKFGGGHALMNPTLTGGASGDLKSPGGITLTTTDFFNEIYQGFTPGSHFQFDLEFTSEVNSPAPDAFAFAILDANLFNIPTDGLGDSLFLLQLDDLNNPTAEAFTALNGVTVTVSAIPAASEVPDSGTTVGLLGLALAGIGAFHRFSIRRLCQA